MVGVEAAASVGVLTYLATLASALAAVVLGGLALKWLLSRWSDHAIAINADMLALVAKGDKPGWDLGIYGTHIVMFRHAVPAGSLYGLHPGLQGARKGAMWLVGEPDKNGWRTGRRIGARELSSIVRDAPADAPKEAA